LRGRPVVFACTALLSMLFLIVPGAPAHAQVCYEIDDEIICHEEEEPETPPEDNGEPETPSEDNGEPETPPDSSWSGFSDGRLNPDPAEYYSLWCAFDRVEIWRSVPTTELLKLPLLRDILNLSEGQAMDLGDFMSLVRNTSDTITVYGSNGNRAPEPGQKSFSLSECIARNGGLPPEESTAANGSSDEDRIGGFDLWCSDPVFFRSNFDICLETAGLDSLSMILARLMFMCNAIPLVMVGGWFFWRGRRHG
jgi:hypothetical protein